MTADKNKEELIPTEPVIVGNNADGVIIENISKPDDATLALQRQLADLRKSEELQRQHATQMMAARAQPPTREQKLAMWKQQGMSPADEQFLAENRQMIDLHDLTAVAAGEAAEQGHERDSNAHRRATKENFNRHLAHLQAQQAQAAASDPAPAFFAPPPAASPAPPGPASYVSAPVSRSAVGGTRRSIP